MSRADLSPEKLAFLERTALAMQHARESVDGMILASTGTAQVLWESGFGAHAPGNNYLGIKAGGSWNGPTVNFATHEVVNGDSEAVHADFRAYDSLEACCLDYAQVMTTHAPYAAARALLSGHQNSAHTATITYDGRGMTVAEAYTRAIAAVYATDPNYANGVWRTVTDYELGDYDCPVSAAPPEPHG